MTICDKCKKEVGNLFCGNCREAEKRKSLEKRFGDLIPLLYWDKDNKQYVVGCLCVGCPWNNAGKCVTTHLFIKSIQNLLHEFDGDNIIHQACG